MNVSNLPKQNMIADLSVKKLANRSLLLLLSLSFKLFAQIAVIFIYARHLSYQDYGSYQSVWLYTNIIGVIGLFGLPSLILSASIKNIKNWIGENKITFWIGVILMNLIPFTYILFFYTQLSFSIRLLLTALIITQNVCIITETIAIKSEKEKLVLISNIIFNIGFLGYHIFVLYYGYTLHLLLTGLIILYLVKTFFVMSFSYRIRIHEKNVAIPNLGKQWLYLGLNDTLGIIFKWLDKWVILLLVSVTQFAVYFNGSYEIPVFALMLSAVGNIMLVELSKHSMNDRYIKMLFNTSSILLASIVFPSFAFLLFYHTDFFILIFSKKYADAIPVFVISIFIIPVRITYYTAVLQIRHRSDLIVRGSAIDLIIAIVLIFILYPFLQMRGLALAFVISTYAQAGYYLWETSRVIHQKIDSFFPLQKLLWIMLISILITAPPYFLFNQIQSKWGLIIGVIITIILIIGLLKYNIKKSHVED